MDKQQAALAMTFATKVPYLTFSEKNETNFLFPKGPALRALGLLLADGTPTVGGGKTF